GSNARIRVFPVSPYTRTTSCFVAPRTYRLPDDDVPFALNEAMSLVPSRIGSEPGGDAPGSTAGRPGSVPKSTPPNDSDSRSGDPSGWSTFEAMSRLRTPLPLPSAYTANAYPAAVGMNRIAVSAER